MYLVLHFLESKINRQKQTLSRPKCSDVYLIQIKAEIGRVSSGSEQGTVKDTWPRGALIYWWGLSALHLTSWGPQCPPLSNEDGAVSLLEILWQSNELLPLRYKAWPRGNAQL